MIIYAATRNYTRITRSKYKWARHCNTHSQPHTHTYSLGLHTHTHTHTHTYTHTHNHTHKHIALFPGLHTHTHTHTHTFGLVPRPMCTHTTNTQMCKHTNIPTQTQKTDQEAK